VIRGVAVRAPPAIAQSIAASGYLALGKSIVGTDSISATISNSGFLFTGLALEQPIINPGINQVTSTYSINQTTPIYSINKIT
jgi:hypothetical protein